MKYHGHVSASSKLYVKRILGLFRLAANGYHGRTAVSFYSSNTSVCLCVVTAVVGACRWIPVPIK